MCSESGAPGLVDRVFAVHAGSPEFDSHQWHMSEQFLQSNRPGYPHPCALSWKIVVSEWRSVTAVSLNVGSGVRLIKPAKLYMCTQTYYKHDEDGRTAPGVSGHGSVPLSRGTLLRKSDYSQNVFMKHYAPNHMHVSPEGSFMKDKVRKGAYLTQSNTYEICS